MNYNDYWGRNNNGYIGYEMSVRAYEAYEDGEKPLSKFTTKDVKYLNELLESFGYRPVKLKVWQLKKWLTQEGWSSWHHTGACYQQTYFYSILYSLTGYTASDYTLVKADDFQPEALKSLYAAAQLTRHKEPVTANYDWYYAEIEYGEWSGPRTRLKLKSYTEIALVYDNWAYISPYKKKNVYGRHFCIVKNLGRKRPQNFDAKFAQTLKKKYNLKCYPPN